MRTMSDQEYKTMRDSLSRVDTTRLGKKKDLQHLMVQPDCTAQIKKSVELSLGVSAVSASASR
jgi:hypothetical protein